MAAEPLRSIAVTPAFCRKRPVSTAKPFTGYG
jgi:hypothetical protein